MTFLNMLTTIVPGHGTLWHFCAQPQVASITFSPDYSQATVAFRILYRGGEAVFHKEGDTWAMAHSRLLWIE